MKPTECSLVPHRKGIARLPHCGGPRVATRRAFFAHLCAPEPQSRAATTALRCLPTRQGLSFEGLEHVHHGLWTGSVLSDALEEED